MTLFKLFSFLGILLLFILAVYYSNVIDTLSFEELKAHRKMLIGSVQTYPFIAPIFYMIVYIVITSLSLPVDVILLLAGGFLFPQPYSTVYATIGASVGAICLFIIARTALGRMIKRRAGPFLSKMEAGFQENAASYLLFLRFIPIFPFWLVNIAPAFFGVSLSTFAWTTIFGVIPCAFVLTQAGTGLGAILDSGETLSIRAIFNSDIIIALIALGMFALMPVILKSFMRNYNKPYPP